LTSTYTQALTAHWRAVAHLEVARQAAAEVAVPPLGMAMPVREVVARLGHAGNALAVGWLGEDLAIGISAAPGLLSTAQDPHLVRVGEARLPAAGAFPALERYSKPLSAYSVDLQGSDGA
jgi:hypothetical protein